MSKSQTETSILPTRGKGLLESFLAHQRARQANLLIPPELRQGRILDIGCGSFPYFLAHTFFTEKFAIERNLPGLPAPDIRWFAIDLNRNTRLPFEDSFFSAITLLAVVEHLDPTRLTALFQEAYRVLHPGGRVIITTPAAWSDNLLHWMARINLVSAEEIEEHAYAYTLPLLGWYFGSAGFAMDKVHFGYFELMLNMWAMAER